MSDPTRSYTLVIGGGHLVTGTGNQTTRRQHGLRWTGTSDQIVLPRPFQTLTTELIVNGRQWTLRSAETENPDLWEYEELSDRRTLRVRYPDSIGAGEPVIVRYIQA